MLCLLSHRLGISSLSRCLQNRPQWRLMKNSMPLLKKSNVAFHTSSPRRLHPLIVLIVVKPLSRFAAIASGWAVKRWWQKLSKEDKHRIKNHFSRRRMAYGGLLLFLMGTAYALYENNVTTNPYTGRRRFMLYNPIQLTELAKQSFKEAISIRYNGNELVKPDEPVAKYLLTIFNKLLQSNLDYKEVGNRDWTIYIIDSDKEIEVASFASGEIIFCTGMLRFFQNEHQVAHILAHEMSHVILEHHAEKASHGYLLCGLLTLPLAILWAIIPYEIVAAVSGWIFGNLVEVGISSPYSREQEFEADAFSLKIMAKACYDVREASVFWGNMAIIKEALQLEVSGKWFSTHPSDSQRQVNLDGQMLDAIMIRQICKCKDLPKEDPRHLLWRREQMKVVSAAQKNPQKEISLENPHQGTLPVQGEGESEANSNGMINEDQRNDDVVTTRPQTSVSEEK